MNRKTDYRVGVGASSILMVLVVLALAAMSLLSLSAARNSEALGDRALDMTTNYYQAVSEAQRMLAAMPATQSRVQATASRAAIYASVWFSKRV